jgi:hypothetical protein
MEGLGIKATDKISRGSISFLDSGVIITFRINGKDKRKTFLYCSRKRTKEQTENMAADFYNSWLAEYDKYLLVKYAKIKKDRHDKYIERKSQMLKAKQSGQI